MFFDVSAKTDKFDAKMRQVQATREKIAAKEKKNTEAYIRIENQRVATLRRIEDVEKELGKLTNDNTDEAKKRVVQLNSEYKNLLGTLEKLEGKSLKNIGAKAKIDAQKADFQGAGYGGSALGALAKGGLALAGIGSIGMAGAKLKDLIDQVDLLGENAQAIGTTASALYELRYQAKLAGVDAGELDKNLMRFNANLGKAASGAGEQAKIFEKFGVSVRNSDGSVKSMNEVLPEVADGFSKLGSVAEKTEAATALFGRSGIKMVQMLEQGGDALKEAFNSTAIDEAAAAAGRFNDAIDSLSHSAMPKLYKVAGELAGALDHLFRMESTDEYASRVAKERAAAAKRQKEAEEARIPILEREKKLRAQIAADMSVLNNLRGDPKYEEAVARREEMIAKAQEKLNRILPEAEAMRKRIADRIAEGNSLLDFQISEEERVKRLYDEMKSDKEVLNKFDKDSLDYANAYVSLSKKKAEYVKLQASLEKQRADAEAAANKKRLDDLKKIENERLKAAEAELKKFQSQSDAIKDRQKQQSEARADFELKTKISILEAQGKTREAEAIKFAQARNQLMEKYGYSLEQATRVQKTLNDLQNAKEGKGDAKYSDEAVKRAQKVLERGEGGSVGKKTLEDARAIVEGRTPEGGFQTAMFEKYAPQENKSKKSLKNINIDAKATRDNLDKKGKEAENKDTQALIALEKQMTDLNKVVDDIKNFVGKIAIKKESAA